MLTTDRQRSSHSSTMDTPIDIRVYNTLSKTKEPFEPLAAGKVGIYLCGPTVYKPSHIGHMVGPVIFDTIKRFLTHSGYEVTLVINITDIDDKLIVEAKNRGTTVGELAKEMIADYFANLEALGIDTVDHFPRATENMDEIIRFTQSLVDRGFAYQAEEGGDIYFDVSKDTEYGKLSHRTVDSLQGEGGEMRERKRNVADFALWKGAKPGEPSWPSPWGPGRPGWHIECSAMSRRILGETFDIHGGGLDLVFPHHENEVAQSECCHGKPLAKYWLHNGLMQAADEVGKVGGRATRAAGEVDAAAQEAGKMGKSKGASAFRDLLTRHSPETVRFFLLSTHYRRPIYFSDERLREVMTSLETFYRYFKRYERLTGESFYDVVPPSRRDETLAETISEESAPFVKLRDRFFASLDDDFNTGGAMADLFELVRALNRYIDAAQLDGPGKADAQKLTMLKLGTRILREMGSILGLFREPPKQSASGDDELLGKLVGLLIELRTTARGKKDFATADRVRDALAEFGIALEDRPDGTQWTLNR